MTKRIHPAARARTLTGATTFLALVGIVSGFQFAANAQTAGVAGGSTTPAAPSVAQAIDPATGKPIDPNATTVPVAEAVPAPAAAAPVAAPVAAPAQAAPVPAVAPAAPAPVSATTGGSGVKP